MFDIVITLKPGVTEAWGHPLKVKPGVGEAWGQIFILDKDTNSEDDIATNFSTERGFRPPLAGAVTKVVVAVRHNTDYVKWLYRWQVFRQAGVAAVGRWVAVQ